MEILSKEETTVLDYVSSVINHNQVENKLNCFGSASISSHLENKIAPQM